MVLLKRFAAALIVFSFVFPFASAASAAENELNYVALGDSIAAHYGLSEDEGYVKLVSDMLVAKSGYTSVNLTNLAVSGDDSEELLQRINDNKDILAKADAVTICIGGNNYLSTMVQGMMSAVSSMYAGMLPGGAAAAGNLPPGFLESMIAELQSSDAGAFMDMFLTDEVYQLAVDGLNSPEIKEELANGVARFKNDLPVIISTVKGLSPNAEIFIMTVYNPFEPSNPIYPFLDDVTNQINDIIKAAKDAHVIDVYKAFEEHNGKGTKEGLTLGLVDPHPNANGHKLIADAHFAVMSGVFAYEKENDESADEDADARPKPETEEDDPENEEVDEEADAETNEVPEGGAGETDETVDNEETELVDETGTEAAPVPEETLGEAAETEDGGLPSAETQTGLEPPQTEPPAEAKDEKNDGANYFIYIAAAFVCALVLCVFYIKRGKKAENSEPPKTE